MKRWPVYDEQQIADVVDLLRSGKVNAWTGSHVARFEEAYAARLGRRHAIALANGTVALDLALKVLEIRPGDEVIVSPRSFIASASCVPFAGATPVFADVDPYSGCLTAKTIEKCITARTKAVIVVHLGGWPADMTSIMLLARRYGLKVIEDCAQAHGAEHSGFPIGSCGDIAAFSFCQDKIITTGGEGGLLAMDDEAIWEKAWSLKDHGKSYDTVFHRTHPVGFRWLHETIGTNWRMTGIQAALGLRQLERLDEWREKRARNAEILWQAVEDVPLLRTPRLMPSHRHAWYRFYTYVRRERLAPGWTRDRIVAAVEEQGVPCYSGSCSEVYLEQAFVRMGLGPERRLPNARRLGEESLALLVDPCLSEVDMMRSASVLRAVALEACRQTAAA